MEAVREETKARNPQGEWRGDLILIQIYKRMQDIRWRWRQTVAEPLSQGEVATCGTEMRGERARLTGET